MNFCSLSSGSSGNCYYLGNGEQGILIDAGISASSVRKFLRDLDIPMQSIMGILVSHNHSDHIRGLSVLSRRNSLPVFTTGRIWDSILSADRKMTVDRVRKIDLQQKFSLAGFSIEAFPVSHDAPETIGFHIKAGEKKVTIATDLGHICQTSADYLRAANLLVIEANYDEQMLKTGKYPWFLKSRIMSDHGHLGNHQTAAFLSENTGAHLSLICLAHLSRNNNTPELALRAVTEAFLQKGIEMNGTTRIVALDRHVPTGMLSF